MRTVKKLGKILGLVGGVVAILWAMRDRLVSIAAPQDPEPPRFRVVPPAAPPVEPPADLTSITGIGPVFARRLQDAGIATFADLTTAGVDRVAEITGAPEARVQEWVDQAASLV